jgi:hypothetical protein
MSQIVEENFGSYWLLQEVYEMVCTYYNTHGEVIEERSQVPMK